MGTKIFHAIQDADVVKAFYEKTGKKLNILISYAYLAGNAVKLTNDYREMIQGLYLDSGAYSANQGRTKISVYEYALYIKRYGHRFDYCFNFDDRFSDPEHNLQNFRYLCDKIDQSRVHLVPVIHDQENPIEELNRYYEMGERFIAVGSSGKNLSETEISTIRSMEGLKTHMFGDLAREMLIRVQPFSADSASSQHMTKFGTIYFWDREDSREYAINLGARRRKDQDNSSDGKNVHIDNFRKTEALKAFLADTFGYDLAHLPTDHKKQRIVNHYFLWQLETEILPLEITSAQPEV